MKVGMYLADKRENDIMSALGARPLYHLYLSKQVAVATITDSRPPAEIAATILEEGKDTIVAAVYIDGQMYFQPGIKVVTYEGREIFVS